MDFLSCLRHHRCPDDDHYPYGQPATGEDDGMDTRAVVHSATGNNPVFLLRTEYQAGEDNIEEKPRPTDEAVDAGAR